MRGGAPSGVGRRFLGGWVPRGLGSQPTRLCGKKRALAHANPPFFKPSVRFRLLRGCPVSFRVVLDTVYGG